MGFSVSALNLGVQKQDKIRAMKKQFRFYIAFVSTHYQIGNSMFYLSEKRKFHQKQDDYGSPTVFPRV